MDNGVIGISDHGGWAVLVTSTHTGKLLDRRRVELVDNHLPKIPHHCEAQGLPLDQAVELIDRVRHSAERHAAHCLETIAASVAQPILGIALRECPPLPLDIADRIRDYRAQNLADWVMYRKALASAAEARGWTVHWFDSKRVLSAAAQVLQLDDFESHSAQMRRCLGPPWSKDHKLAMAAAVVAANHHQACGLNR